jgi:hypothetical protein
MVSRIALADVSGHGQTVAVFGERLRELMRRYLLDLNQVVRSAAGTTPRWWRLGSTAVEAWRS